MARDGNRSGMRYAGLGFEFAAGTAGLVFLGYWIDRRYESEPWGLLIGLGIGLVGGTYNLIKAARDLSGRG